MGTEEQGAERALPDLRERIDMAIGQLTVLAQNARDGVKFDQLAAGTLEEVMLMLAGLQEVVSWEPTGRLDSPRAVAEQLRQMAAVGPRPPAVVLMLGAACGHVMTAADARQEAASAPDEELLAQLVTAERRAYDIAEDAIAQGRRLAELQQRMGGR